MPFLMEPECGPKCRSKQHNLAVNAVITKGSLQDLQAYSRLCHTWAQHTDTAGRSALHVAASCGKLDVVDWLLAEKHLDLSLKDRESGWTALHRALFYGQLATARLLIQNNADLYCRDHEGLGPLDLLSKDRPVVNSFSGDERSEVYSWGDNTNLTLGHGSEQHRTVPEMVDTFRRHSVYIHQIAMCKYHTVFLAFSGQVYTCGHGHGGRLGHGDEVTCVTPRLVEAVQEEITQVAAARDHTLFLSANNCVYSCGLNSCHQLGQTVTGDLATSKSLLPVKMNMKGVKGNVIKGVYAGRFHSVVHTEGGIFTCGLNAGQLGQPKGEQYQSQLRQVSLLHCKDDVYVSHLDTSDAAMVCCTSRGDLFLMHEYTCRKIASRWQDISKVCVAGGNLDHNTDLDVLREKGGSEVKVVLLNTFGKVFMWRSGQPNLRRCQFAVRRQVCVKDVGVNAGGLLLLTEEGQAFTGYPTGRRSTLPRDTNRDANREFGKVSLLELMLGDEVEEISLRRVPVVHRAMGLACDRKGRNFAVTQGLPIGWLASLPELSKSQIHTEYQQLMEEADVYDAIHDCVVQVGNRKWACHSFILASRADYFRKQVPCLASLQPCPEGGQPIISVSDVSPEVMAQLLKFIYTDTCDVLQCGSTFTFPLVDKVDNSGSQNGGWHEEVDTVTFDGRVTSAFEVKVKQRGGEKKGRGKGSKGGRKEDKGKADPVKILQEAARKFGVKGLSKRLGAVRWLNNMIQPVGGKELPLPRIQYDRTKLGELYDVCIRASDNTTFQCHKCVLAARLEYFHSMLGSGWIETSDTESLSLPVPGDILEILLDFIYQDHSSVVAESDDLELLCNVLVVADQLLVQRLKELCELTLTKLMTLRNAGELLEIASTYNAEQLVTACHQFIFCNLPALLESRNLDMLSEDTMQELTDSYRSSVNAMSCRVITPWSEGPDSNFLAALTADVNKDLTPKARDINTGKKPKAKRRQQRTKSMGEEAGVGAEGSQGRGGDRDRRLSEASDGGAPSAGPMAERQVSVTSNASARSDDDAVLMENGSGTAQVGMTAATAVERSGSKAQKWLPFNMAPVQGDRARGSCPEAPPPSSSSSGSSSSISAGPGISLRSIMQEQKDTSHNVKRQVGGKFSWKEVKKQQQTKAAQALQKAAGGGDSTAGGGGGGTSPSVASSPPVCPWGGSVNKVVPSFRDLMLQDKGSQPPVRSPSTTTPTMRGPTTPTSPSPRPQSSVIRMTSSSPANVSTKNSMAFAAHAGKSPPPTTSTVSKSSAQASFSWGLPVRIPFHPQATASSAESPVVACSPPPQENPWQKGLTTPTSPTDGGGTMRTSVSFSDIVQDQMDQKHSLERAAQKPLHLIQMEEEALSQLMQHYHAHERCDERITVERKSGPMAAPLWKRQRTTSSSLQ